MTAINTELISQRKAPGATGPSSPKKENSGADMKIQNPRSRAYKIFSIIVLVVLAILFLFPLYWIITGASP